MANTPSIDIARARAFLWQTQGLTRRLETPQDVLNHGWLSTCGTCTPHLACFARMRKARRSAIDDAYRAGVLLDVPAVHGTRMLVPQEDRALALSAAKIVFEKRLRVLKERYHVDTSVVPETSDRVYHALDQGPLSLRELRHNVLDKVKPAADAMDAIWERSGLPLALRDLEVRGLIERDRLEEGPDPLDSRFRQTQWDRGELEKTPSELVPLLTELAEQFLRWTGIASPDDFAHWVGFDEAAAHEAMNRVDALEVNIEDIGPARILQDNLEALNETDPAEESGSFRFLPHRDNLLFMRRALSPFVEPSHRSVSLPGFGWKKRPLVELTSVSTLTIFEGHHLIGIWDYDTTDEDLMVRTFDSLRGERGDQFDRALDEFRQFLREEIRKTPCWPLESDRSRHERRRVLVCV